MPNEKIYVIISKILLVTFWVHFRYFFLPCFTPFLYHFWIQFWRAQIFKTFVIPVADKVDPSANAGSDSNPEGSGNTDVVDEAAPGTISAEKQIEILEEESASFTSAIRENHVPQQCFYILLFLFVCILLDRAVYLRKSKLGKIIVQYILVIIMHFAVFFVFPYTTRLDFYNNRMVMFIYLSKCFYFLFSAEQIRGKYPTRILQNFLTTGYGYFNLFTFMIYRLLPFIVEIQNTMDWMFVDTTLGIGKWFMLNTVYSQIYQLKCWRHLEDEYQMPRGVKKPGWLKYTSGGFMLAGLVLLLWFPLLFVHVVQVSIFLKIFGQFRFFFRGTQILLESLHKNTQKFLTPGKSRNFICN